MRIEASKTVTEDIDAEFASLEEFREKHPDFAILAIDDKEVVALCEACGEPIYEGDDYHTGDEDLIYVHATVECAPPEDYEPEEFDSEEDEEPRPRPLTQDDDDD